MQDILIDAASTLNWNHFARPTSVPVLASLSRMTTKVVIICDITSYCSNERWDYGTDMLTTESPALSAPNHA